MSERQRFLSPKPLLDSLHDYQLRGDILRALKNELETFHGTFLDVGCGRMPYKSLILSPPSRVEHYLGMDVEGNLHGAAVDIFFDGVSIPISNDRIHSAMATEVLEHCADPGRLLREIFRVLRPGGVFFYSVPFLWPLHEVPYDHYRYTPYSLERHLSEAGFEETRIRAHGGWDASLGQMLGLWVTYRSMLPWKRKMIAILLRPIIRLLNFCDTSPGPNFGEAIMFTGLSGTARKPCSPTT